MHKQENDKEAITALKKAIYLNPGFVLTHFLLGNIYIKNGHSTLGEKYLNNATTILSHLNPNDIIPQSGGLTVALFSELITADKLSNNKDAEL